MSFYVFRLSDGEVIAGVNSVTELTPYLNNANGVTFEDAPLRDWTYLTVADGAITIDTEQWASARRVERDQRLRDSDYTQLADITDAHLPGTRAEWATYRQELRDVPAQAGFPETVTWPAQPTEV